MVRSGRHLGRRGACVVRLDGPQLVELSFLANDAKSLDHLLFAHRNCGPSPGELRLLGALEILGVKCNPRPRN
eukprot:3152035-Pyramimonas_sp.AAC.1